MDDINMNANNKGRKGETRERKSVILSEGELRDNRFQNKK